MGEGRLNFDDMLKLTVEVGPDPEGRLMLNMSGLGHGATHVDIESDGVVIEAIVQRVREHLASVRR